MERLEYSIRVWLLCRDTIPISNGVLDCVGTLGCHIPASGAPRCRSNSSSSGLTGVGVGSVDGGGVFSIIVASQGADGEDLKKKGAYY